MSIEAGLGLAVLSLIVYPLAMWGIIRAHESETKEKENDKKENS
jgi:hypothetical protein